MDLEFWKYCKKLKSTENYKEVKIIPNPNYSDSKIDN